MHWHIECKSHENLEHHTGPYAKHVGLLLSECLPSYMKMYIHWYYHYHYHYHYLIIIIIIIIIIMTYCVLEENDLSSSIVYKFMCEIEIKHFPTRIHIQKCRLLPSLLAFNWIYVDCCYRVYLLYVSPCRSCSPQSAHKLSRGKHIHYSNVT